MQKTTKRARLSCCTQDYRSRSTGQDRSFTTAEPRDTDKEARRWGGRRARGSNKEAASAPARRELSAVLARMAAEGERREGPEMARDSVAPWHAAVVLAPGQLLLRLRGASRAVVLGAAAPRHLGEEVSLLRRRALPDEEEQVDADQRAVAQQALAPTAAEVLAQRQLLGLFFGLLAYLGGDPVCERCSSLSHFYEGFPPLPLVCFALPFFLCNLFSFPSPLACFPTFRLSGF